MLSSQVKFSADRQTDTAKTICPRSINGGGGQKVSKFEGRQFLKHGGTGPSKLCLAKLQYVTNVCTNFQTNRSRTVGGAH